MKTEVKPGAFSETADFERERWSVVDQQHFGRTVAWEEWIPTPFLFKAEGESGLVGVIAGYCTAGVVYIDRIIVDEENQKQKVGQTLMQHAEDHARNIGAHKIYLFTGKTWGPHEFFLKLGYALKGELPNHYMQQDYQIYSKDLAVHNTLPSLVSGGENDKIAT